MVAQKMQSLAHLAAETFQLRFGGGKVGAEFRWTEHYMPSLTHREVTAERDHIGGNVDQQHTAEADVVVHKADDGAGNQPSSLHASQQERIGLHERPLRCEFLNQRGDGRPEHPETGGHQRVHQIELPDLHVVPKRENGDGYDDDRAHGVEPHDEAAPVFAIDQDAGEGKHEHGGQRLQHRELSQRHLRVRGLQNVPGDRGRVHPAAQHRDHVGREHKAQGTLAEDGAHLFYFSRNG